MNKQPEDNMIPTPPHHALPPPLPPNRERSSSPRERSGSQSPRAELMLNAYDKARVDAAAEKAIKKERKQERAQARKHKLGINS